MNECIQGEILKVKEGDVANLDETVKIELNMAYANKKMKVSEWG